MEPMESFPPPDSNWVRTGHKYDQISTTFVKQPIGVPVVFAICSSLLAQFVSDYLSAQPPRMAHFNLPGTRDNVNTVKCNSSHDSKLSIM